MSEEKNNSNFNKINYSEYISPISEMIKLSVGKYWEQNVNLVLQAINDFWEFRDEKLIKNVDFFSSQIKVDKHKPVVIRLSKNFIEKILEVSLENKSGLFKLDELTPLEIKILNNFCEFLYKRLNEALIPVKDTKITEKSEKNINLLYMIGLKDNASQIMVSIPQDRIAVKYVEKKLSFKDEDFITSKTYVRVKAGSTKITLDELQNLSVDDIVVLEKSSSSKLILISGDLEKKFNVKIDPSIILDIDEDEKSDNNDNFDDEVIMEKNLWDDIQIEVNAEFEKVKMTIGELKQITQGQIVDLGSIFDGEISLFVEDKKVAKGELIVINDRYAVKLNEVLSSNTKQSISQQTIQQQKQPQSQAKPQAATQAKPQPQAQAKSQAKPQPKPQVQAQAQSKPQPKPQPKPAPKQNEEEFDYSDFEK